MDATINSSSNPQRRLAAIMFTDIVGYSRLISADERKGLALLAEHDEIVLGIVAEHKGNVLKQMGDAVFAEFSSSVSAVNCAVAIQGALKIRNDNKPDEERILIRIGLHLGDVSVQGDDLFGEGINVAARLEPLAQPGGICMSQAVYQSVKSHTNIAADHVGEVDLKNIIEKYTIYKVPSVYEEYHVDSEAGDQDDEGLLDFEIKSVEKMPPPSRSFGKMLVAASIFMPLLMIASLVANIIFRYEPGVSRVEVLDMKGLILKLQNKNDAPASQIRGKLDGETIALIDHFTVTDSLPDDAVTTVRRSLNRVIRSGTVIFNPQIIASLDVSRQITDLIQAEPEGKKMSKLNRLLVGRAFRSEIQESPESVIQMSFRILRFMAADPFILVINLFYVMLVVLTAYFMAFTTRRVRFADVREVDKLLGHFTEEMGFKEPVKVKGVLVFKPTIARWIKDFFVAFPAAIRVRVDGNSVIITSTIPKVKRLMKQLQAYSA